MGIRYKVFPLRAIDKAEFFDATAEELRLLIALIECAGDADEETLAEASGITPGRCRASLRFWTDAGVIYEESTSDVKIIEEYPEVVNRGELIEESGVKVAEDIRNNNLKPLFDELAVIFERNLTTREAKIVSGIIEQYGVSSKYIKRLAAYLKKTKGFTVAKLRDRTKALTNKEIDNLEALEVYISVKEKEIKREYEMRGMFGIYDRTFSKTEHKFFKTWTEELGYGADVISIAYDITVMHTGNRSLPYMNEILLSWSKAGLKTPKECREYSEKNKPEAKSTPTKKKPKENKPRYGNFDIDEAFANALQRSYGEESEKK